MPITPQQQAMAMRLRGARAGAPPMDEMTREAPPEPASDLAQVKELLMQAVEMLDNMGASDTTALGPAGG